MRRVLVLLLLVPLFAFVVGCGESKPDPRERADFVDTSDPSTVIDTMGNKADQPK
jgi:hypothetical protein